jgi:hypothetical protein
VAVAKYDPLFEFLCRADDGAVTLTFDAIEALVSATVGRDSERR